MNISKIEQWPLIPPIEPSEKIRDKKRQEPKEKYKEKPEDKEKGKIIDIKI